MNISHNDFQIAALKAGIAQDQIDVCWRELQATSTNTQKPKFNMANVAYYLGALLVIGAMGWFMTEAWDTFGGGGLLAIALGYALAFLVGGSMLWNRGMKIPGGLLVTITVCMTPLVVYGLERWLGWWPKDDPGSYTKFHPVIHASWIAMEVATVLAGIMALRFWRFPFITAPIAYVLWFLSMDLAALSIGRELPWEQQLVFSAAFGAIMLVVTYFVDLWGKADDYAFWGYLFGLLTVWGSLSAMYGGNEFKAALYGLLHIGFMMVSLILRRRTFLVFGSLGLFGYLGRLADRFFADSIWFPFVLSLVGISVIIAGICYQRRSHAIEACVRTTIAPKLRRFLPARAFAEN